MAALPTIGAGNVLVTNPSSVNMIQTSTSQVPDAAGVYGVTFVGALAGQNLDEITIPSAGNSLNNGQFVGVMTIEDGAGANNGNEVQYLNTGTPSSRSP